MIELIPRPRTFKGGGEGDSNESLWLVCYSDLITNVMLFFLVMWILQLMENRKQVQQQLEEAFGKETTAERVKERAAEAVQQAKEEAVAETLADELKDVGEVKVTQSFVRLSLPGPILFAFADDALSGEGRGVLSKVADTLKRVPNEVIVEGHTDDRPVTGGPFRDNMQLSMARAYSVIRQLSQSGVPGPRLVGTGYGPSRPVADNKTADGRRLNRRVEIVVVRKQAAPAEKPAPASEAPPHPAPSHH